MREPGAADAASEGGMSEILETARAVIARHDASPNSMHMSFCDAAPALAREVIRLHAAVTDEDREAAAWFKDAAELKERHAAMHRESLPYCPRNGPDYAAMCRFAAEADVYAARYRRAAEALLRPDETAALRAEVAALKAERDGARHVRDLAIKDIGRMHGEIKALEASLASARAAAFEEAAKVADGVALSLNDAAVRASGDAQHENDMRWEGAQMVAVAVTAWSNR